MEKITIKIQSCDCSECEHKNYIANIEGIGIDESTGGYEDLESAIDGAKKLILELQK